MRPLKLPNAPIVCVSAVGLAYVVGYSVIYYLAVQDSHQESLDSATVLLGIAYHLVA